MGLSTFGEHIAHPISAAVGNDDPDESQETLYLSEPLTFTLLKLFPLLHSPLRAHRPRRLHHLNHALVFHPADESSS